MQLSKAIRKRLEESPEFSLDTAFEEFQEMMEEYFDHLPSKVGQNKIVGSRKHLEWTFLASKTGEEAKRRLFRLCLLYMFGYIESVFGSWSLLDVRSLPVHYCKVMTLGDYVATEFVAKAAT